MKKIFLTANLIIGLLVVLFMGLSYAEDPILIGVPTAETSLEGRESIKAVQMAVDEINAKGGVNVGKEKRLLKVLVSDLRDSSAGVPVSEALLGLEKIITEKKVNAILVGPFRSESLLAGMDIIAKYKVPLLETIAMSPKFEEKVKEDPVKYRHCFRVCLNAQSLVGYLAQSLGFLKEEFGFNKMYVMTQDVLWAKATGGGVSKVATTKMGYELVGSETYPTGASDFSAGLMKARIKNAQVILPVFDMPQSGILLKQWKSQKIPSLLCGFISPMAGPAAWKIFEGKLGGLLNSNFELGSAIPVRKYPPATKFYEDYQTKFRVPMEAGHGPAPSYDAVYILAEAIERAGSLDPDKIADEIKKTDRVGVIGKIKFNDGNQVIYGADPKETAAGCVYQWTEDGKRVIVFPKSIAEGKIVLPEWISPSKK
ncbi:MAG: ABC transporter substrate-binding protein [Syntrophaceae bacterium]|nr:ABC transporter substrate-binding protein [Syntrophaceae bacterium]